MAASTQNQALNAIVFIYRQVLKKDFGWLEGVQRSKKPVRLPCSTSRVPRASQATPLAGSTLATLGERRI